METQGLGGGSHGTSDSSNGHCSKDSHEQSHEDQDFNALHDSPTRSAFHHEYAPNGKPRSSSMELKKTSSGLRSARAHLGLHPIAPIIEEHDVAAHSDLWWPRIRLVLKEPFAEFFGVFIMVLFGNGSVAQVLLSAGQTSAPGGNGFGAYQSISWGWGLGVMLGIYVAGDSGAYLKYGEDETSEALQAWSTNNAPVRQSPLQIASCASFRGGMSSHEDCLSSTLQLTYLLSRRFPAYFIAQFLGGFAGAGVVYANYINEINVFEGHDIRTVPPSKTATAAIFCTYPQAPLTKASQFFSEFIASTILMFVIFALKDDSNKGQFSAAGNWFPLGLFFLIFGLGACFGWETGYAINLARDFGPRLMSYAVGYGNEVWSAGGYYFWIPMVRPWLERCLLDGCADQSFRLRHFAAASLAACCTISSCTRARARSTRRGSDWRTW